LALSPATEAKGPRKIAPPRPSYLRATALAVRSGGSPFDIKKRKPRRYRVTPSGEACPGMCAIADLGTAIVRYLITGN
jgi:hypothetical protein